MKFIRKKFLYLPLFLFLLFFCFYLFKLFNDFEKKLIFSIRINTFLGIKNKTYMLSNYISYPFDGIIFYSEYNDEFHKFRLFNANTQKGIKLKLNNNGELSKNQLLINMDNYDSNVYAFRCDKLKSSIVYIGYNDLLKSYEFQPIGCNIIYKK